MSFFELHHPHYHLTRMSEMGKVFWAHSLGSVASSLAAVFIPIFLLNLGYSLSDIFLYYAMLGGFSVFLQYPASVLISRTGGNRMMAVGIFFHVVFFALLLTLEAFQWPLWTAAVAWTFSRVTYWAAYHADFSKASAHKQTGRKVGLMSGVVTLAHGVAPAIGGVVATRFGIDWVYGVAIGLFLIGLLPLLRGAEVTARRPFDPKLVRWRKILPDLVASASYGITTLAEVTIWPILIFLLVGSYEGVGLLTSVITIFSIMIALYVGRREEQKGEKHYLKEGVTTGAAAHGFRLFAETGTHVFGINALTGIARPLFYTPYVTKYYEHADEEPRNEYIFAMEQAHSLGWTFYFLLLWGLTLAFPGDFTLWAGIAVAIPFTFLLMRIR